MSIQIAPSILSADFCNLERDLKAIANADLVHVDVMDHHFVPNLTLGEPIVKRICEVTDLPVDVHLMIEDPDRWAPEYAKLGAASVGKVRRLRDEITRRGLDVKIQVDGGVSPKTAHIVAEAGADVLVAGSAVYGAEDPAAAIDAIRDEAAAAFKA